MFAWVRALLAKMNCCGCKEEKGSLGLTGCGGREKGWLRTMHALGLLTVTEALEADRFSGEDHESSFVFTGLKAREKCRGLLEYRSGAQR